MLDKLLSSTKITQDEFNLYTLFHVSELGRKFLDQLVMKTFMEEPTDAEWNDPGFAYFSGRQSIVRNILRSIERVNNIIKEENYVGADGNKD